MGNLFLPWDFQPHCPNFGTSEDSSKSLRVIIEVGRDSVQSELHLSTGTAMISDQVTQGIIQLILENHQGQRQHIISGQCVPVLDTLETKTFQICSQLSPLV